MSKRVVVTGAQGRIGRALVPRLAENFAVLALDRTPSGDAQSICCELTDRRSLLEAVRGADAVIHLAAQHWDCDFHEKLLRDNLEACYNVFEAAREAAVPRLIFASSLHVVDGCVAGAGSVPEATLPCPDSLYAATKLFGEHVGRVFAEQHGLTVLCARIGWFLPEEAPELNDPVARRIWLRLEDMVDFFERCLRAQLPPFSIVNCCSNNGPGAPSLEAAHTILGYAPSLGALRR